MFVIVLQEEDWTDYMQELAGEFTTCQEIFIHQGHWDTGKTAPSGDRVGALIDYVASDNVERQGIDAIAKQTFDKWVQTFPFDEQVCVFWFRCSEIQLFLFSRIQNTRQRQ